MRDGGVRWAREGWRDEWWRMLDGRARDCEIEELDGMITPLIEGERR